ncbi:hypothetical protein ACFC26_09805 [Kitasatospora purpeofusca]|uniref:hypothetical protein n=1 Tax=Kitasatospora purpeofusca TaxID=67352 RepID=UPI0035D8F0CB
MSNNSTQNQRAVEAVYGTQGEQVLARRAPMNLIVFQLNEVNVVALPVEEAIKIGRRILRLADAEDEGGDR